MEFQIIEQEFTENTISLNNNDNGIDVIDSHYKQHLKDYFSYLRTDWKRWAMYQIKYTILMGESRFCSLK